MKADSKGSHSSRKYFSFLHFNPAPAEFETSVQGWIILKISTCPTCPFFIIYIGTQSKFLLVLHHEVLFMASGRVDFSSPECIDPDLLISCQIRFIAVFHSHLVYINS